MKVKYCRLASCVLSASLLCGVSGLSMAGEAETEAAFKKAMASRDAGDLLDSIEILQTLLSQEPSLHRARLELAVAYYRSVQYDEAERQAKKVLDDPNTPPSVRLSIIAFLAQIKGERKRFQTARHSFRPSISVGYLHDSNVNVGPNSDVVNIGAATLRLAAGSTPQSDNAFTISAGINHTFQTGKVVSVGGKSAAVLWQSQAAVYSKQYSELSAFNLDVVSLSTGPAFIVPKKWRSNVSLRVDNIELGSDPLAFYTSLLPSVTWQLGTSAELTVSGSLADRDYKQSGDQGRDSTYKSIGITLGKRYTEKKISVQAGLTLFDEDAKNDVFSRDGIQATAGVSWDAWENGSVYANYSQRKYKHDDLEPLFNVKRDEREEKFVVGFRHEFKGDYLNKWLLNGKYSNTDNASNVDIYKYDREVTSITFSRRF